MIAKLYCPVLKKKVTVWDTCGKKDCQHLIAGINTVAYYRIGNSKKPKFVRVEIEPIIYKCEKEKRAKN